jgi:hypothetical protein
MKTKFKVILYIVAIAAIIGALVLMFNAKTVGMTALPLFCYGLIALVLPVWADSIRDDIEEVSMEELAYNVNHEVKGKYIAEDYGRYTAVIVHDVTRFHHFQTRWECVDWIDKKSKEMK